MLLIPTAAAVSIYLLARPWNEKSHRNGNNQHRSLPLSLKHHQLLVLVMPPAPTSTSPQAKVVEVVVQRGHKNWQLQDTRCRRRRFRVFVTGTDSTVPVSIRSMRLLQWRDGTLKFIFFSATKTTSVDIDIDEERYQY
jgi:hypothetical protein